MGIENGSRPVDQENDEHATFMDQEPTISENTYLEQKSFDDIVPEQKVKVDTLDQPGKTNKPTDIPEVTVDAPQTPIITHPQSDVVSMHPAPAERPPVISSSPAIPQEYKGENIRAENIIICLLLASVVIMAIISFVNNSIRYGGYDYYDDGYYADENYNDYGYDYYDEGYPVDVYDDSYPVDDNYDEDYAVDTYEYGDEGDYYDDFDYSGVIIVTSNLNVRENPSTDSEILYMFECGSVLTPVGYTNGWYEIPFDNGTAYVNGNYVYETSFEELDSQTVGVINATTDVNIRSGPGTNYDRIGGLGNQQKAVYVGKSNGWYEIIIHEGQRAYVSADYVELNWDNVDWN